MSESNTRRRGAHHPRQRGSAHPLDGSTQPLLVLNPNSSASTTRAIEASVSSLATDDVLIRCVTLHDGPPGIESHEDFARAEPLVESFIAGRDTSASGFVVACFSDPGVAAAAERSSHPVVGIQEAAVRSALTLGARFGIVALVDASVERQQRSLEALGVSHRLAASRPLGVRVVDLEARGRVWPRLYDVGTRLRDEDGADSIILGCAGMGGYRDELEQALGLPVVEPCRAGVSEVLARIGSVHATTDT